MERKSGAVRQREYQNRQREKMQLLEGLVEDFVKLHTNVKRRHVVRNGANTLLLTLEIRAPEGTIKKLEEYCKLSGESIQGYVDRVGINRLNEEAITLRIQHREGQEAGD